MKVQPRADGGPWLVSQRPALQRLYFQPSTIGTKRRNPAFSAPPLTAGPTLHLPLSNPPTSLSRSLPRLPLSIGGQHPPSKPRTLFFIFFILLFVLTIDFCFFLAVIWVDLSWFLAGNLVCFFIFSSCSFSREGGRGGGGGGSQCVSQIDIPVSPPFDFYFLFHFFFLLVLLLFWLVGTVIAQEFLISLCVFFKRIKG